MLELIIENTLSAILAIKISNKNPQKRGSKLVAGTGFEPMTFGL